MRPSSTYKQMVRCLWAIEIEIQTKKYTKKINCRIADRKALKTFQQQLLKRNIIIYIYLNSFLLVLDGVESWHS